MSDRSFSDKRERYSFRNKSVEPAQTKLVSKETYYRGKRDLLDADF